MQRIASLTVTLAIVAAGILALPVVGAGACPVDGISTSQSQREAQTGICAAWNVAGDAKLGQSLGNTHRWGAGWIRDFSGGSYGRGGILYGDGPRFAYIVAGPYWQTYVSVGGAPGPLSFPSGTRAFAGHLHRGAAQNTYMTFQGGVINSWAGGTFATWGAILARWNRSGNVTGGLGRPLSNEQNTCRSFTGQVGRYSRFERGVINYVPSINRAFVIAGAIGLKYRAMGYACSRLGLPRGEEFNFMGGKRQSFDGGFIDWRPGWRNARASCLDHHGGYEVC